MQPDTSYHREQGSSSSKPGDKEGISVGLAENFPFNTFLLNWLLSNLIIFFFCQSYVISVQNITFLLNQPNKNLLSLPNLNNFDPGKMSWDMPRQIFSVHTPSPHQTPRTGFQPVDLTSGKAPKKRGLMGRNARCCIGNQV